MNAEGGLSRITKYIGLDRAIAYVVLGRIWSTSAGVVTLYMIVRFLRPEEQGFYYAFSGILGLQIFFELGFSYTLLQCVSHERAHLAWTAGGVVEGSRHAKHRLAALLKVAVRWYGVAAALFFAGILPAGLIFFQRSNAPHSTVEWRVPWVWLMLTEALVLFQSPFFVFLEGTGLVAQVALVRLATSVLTSLALWLALWQRAGLLASPIINTVECVFGSGWLVVRRGKFFADLFNTPSAGAILNWRREVWPFQWRITVSWLSWFFVSQWATPVLFKYKGAITAGQMGLSMSVVLAAQAVGFAWASTKAPQYGVYVAKGEFDKLDLLFFQTLKQAFLVMLLLCSGLVLSVLVVNLIGSPYRLRIVGPLTFVFLIGRMLADFVAYFIAMYLRAHKQEPLLGVSVASAILGGGLTYLCARYWGAMGVAAGSFSVALLSLPVVWIIFTRKRRLWHARQSTVYAG